jgi:bifunctional DNA-binding transcriptional regulator/antitoxin component of YhaV-PrlF toxin-antitoxin module
MTVTVKNKTKTPLVVPVSVRRKAGHQNGEDLEFRVSGGVITILPKRTQADDEYTPEQRRIIDIRLAKADADIKAGRISKAFSDHDEFIADLHKEVAKLSAGKAKRPAK